MTLEEVMKHIADWIADKKTGSIQVNMFKGGISNINLTQCIKADIGFSKKDAEYICSENDILKDLKWKKIA